MEGRASLNLKDSNYQFIQLKQKQNPTEKPTQPQDATL